MALAEGAEPHLNGAARQAWLRRLDDDHDNVRAALTWGRTASATANVRLTGALWWYWFHRGHWREGRAWLDGALARARSGREPSPAARAKACCGAGVLAWAQGDYDAGRRWLAESVALWRVADDPLGLAYALGFLGEVALFQGDSVHGRPFSTESLALFRAGNDRWGLAFAFINAGNAARAEQEDVLAARLYEESVAILRVIDDPWLIGLPLRNLARYAARAGDLARAATLHRESLAFARDSDERWYISRGLEELAAIAAARDEHRRAARLLGAAEALRETIGAPVLPHYRAEYERMVADARHGLDADAFAEAWARGRALPLADAIAEALAEDAPPAPPAAVPTTAGIGHNLSPREQQVLRLLVTGATDREMATALGIGARTVETHVTNILTKLAQPSRLAAVPFAVRHGLA